MVNDVNVDELVLAMAGSIDFDSGSDVEPVSWQEDLQSYRLHIAFFVEYSRISPSLRVYKIFDQEDHEEINNPMLYPTNSRRMNAVVDKLLRKGERNYKRFLDALSKLYGDLYDVITNRKESPEMIEPPCQDESIRFPGVNDQLLDMVLEKYESKKLECEELEKKLTTVNRDVEEKSREMSQLQNNIQELRSRGERYESTVRDMNALKDVLDHVKSENNKLCMRLLDKTEENSRIKERIMSMRIEMDKKENDLKKANRAADSERKTSFRLKRRIQEGPSQRDVSELRKEIEELKIQLAQSKESAVWHDGDIDTRIQMLQSDKDEAIQMCADASEKLNKLREEFNDMETSRDKYLEENEKFLLQIDAMKDDCEMFRNRRDAVWQQLQEVEKEKDQLMKERNEAQTSAQNHMEEKTKYRADIRNLEEILDRKSLSLRQKENMIRELERKLRQYLQMIPGQEHLDLPEPLPTECFRPRLPNIKHYEEYNFKSEFDRGIDSRHDAIPNDNVFPEIPLAKNYGKNCGEIGQVDKRMAIRRRPVLKSGRQNRSTDTPSRTSSTDSEQQRPKPTNQELMVELEADALRDCVRLTGGNATGIFINEVIVSRNSAYVGSVLRPGLKLNKIRTPQGQPFELTNSTLEFANDFIKRLQGTVVLYLESTSFENNGGECVRLLGDSFYVRANFDWQEDDMLNFKRLEVIHVVNTSPSTPMKWEACKVDPYNGNDASKARTVPSLNYCLSNPLPNENRTKKRMSLVESSLYHVAAEVTNVREEDPASRLPYSVVKPAKQRRDMPRPCLFLPQAFSELLAKTLVSTADSLLFSFPEIATISGNVGEFESRLYDRDVVSFQPVSRDVYEIVKTSAIKSCIQKGKHCILNVNENCLSIKEYLRLLQDDDIHPIVLLLKVQTRRTAKMLIPNEKAKQGLFMNDVQQVEDQLKRLSCNFVQVNLDRCAKLEEAIQIVTEKVADEMNRVLWVEDESGLRM